MATDAYVKFGNSKDPAPNGDYLPKYLGDSTDAEHYWWCELRDSGFGVKFPDEEKAGESGGQGKKKATVHVEKVSLKKRVDWASTQLFMMCCEAGKAKIAKSKEEQEMGTIDQVTVHVCKQAGEKKFPFAVIEYQGVRVVSFTINMSEPEPSETIVFESDSFRFGYQATNPNTGLPEGQILWTDQIEARKQDPKSEGSTDGGSSTDGTTPSGGSGATGSGGGGGGAMGNTGSGVGLGSGIGVAAGANFAGLGSGTGSGVLS